MRRSIDARDAGSQILTKNSEFQSRETVSKIPAEVPMFLKFVCCVAGPAGLIFISAPRTSAQAQGKAAAAKSLRCEFALSSVSPWNAAGAAAAAVKPPKLVLGFES